MTAVRRLSSSSSSSSTESKIVHGFAALRQYLLQQKQEDAWSSAPLLYLQNQGSSSSTSNTLSQTCQQVQMVLTQHCNFRTVISQFAPNTTIGFPVSSQIDQQLTLATRTGASSNGVVVAVGSGSVMDLAKATTVMKQTTTAAAAAAAATDDRSVQRPLLLVPATYGAVLAAASPHALLFDTSEQAIVVAESPSSSSSPTIPTTTTTVATLEAARMDPRGRSAAIYAALALALDRLWQQQGFFQKCFAEWIFKDQFQQRGSQACHDREARMVRKVLRYQRCCQCQWNGSILSAISTKGEVGTSA